MDGRRKNKFFFSNIIIGVSTQIIIYELNKVWDGCVMKECVTWECATLKWQEKKIV